MQINPQYLGIITELYKTEDAVTFSMALKIAVIGFFTVIVILAIIALFIKFIAFVFSRFTKGKAVPAKPASAAPAAPAAKPAAKAMRGEITLTDVDEPTAAVIMALVSHNSGIPLDRLDFKSIKLLEDK